MKEREKLPKVKNSASQYVEASIQEKDSTAPKVVKGGDLRAKNSGK